MVRSDDRVTRVTGTPSRGAEAARSRLAALWQRSWVMHRLDPASDAALSAPNNGLLREHAAKEAWGKTQAAGRSDILLKIADVMEANLRPLAEAETSVNVKPIHETANVAIPLSIDHFLSFTDVLHGHEGRMSEIDRDTVACRARDAQGDARPQPAADQENAGQLQPEHAGRLLIQA